MRILVKRVSSLELPIALGVGVAVNANAAQQHTPLASDQIKMRVEHKLSEEEDLRSVKVLVQGYTVTLSGTVPSLWAKEKAIEEAREVDDVGTIVNEMTIVSGESDQAVALEVAQKVRRYVFYTIFDNVDIAVSGGTVTLMGKVLQPYRATEIGRMVTQVHGVREINNRIETLPVSIYDDQIRTTLASRIYNHTVLSKYAFQLDPPIHIVVENGRVTLTGVVHSEVERRVAEVIARHTFGVFSVDNQLTLDHS